MPEELAPPVVAVVASADGGAFLEECLVSLRNQDYPNLEVLVVDDASAADPTQVVASILPGAILRRLPSRRGVSAAFNEAIVGVEGASFFLFCHDDIALDPDAVRRLVEESFRSNAAVAGPKLVGWDDPSRLLVVGLGMTRAGRVVARVDEGELDQAQRDEACEVFAAPAACMLVRADLFTALSGFDEEMHGFGEDVDLCWRAQIAGARVVVAPAARVRHRQATITGERHRIDADALRRRHEIRTVLKNYGLVRRLMVLLSMIAVLSARSTANLLSRSNGHSLGVLRALRWNIAHRSSLLRGRQILHEIRQVGDGELLMRMSRASSARARLAAAIQSAAVGRVASPGSFTDAPATHERLSRAQLRAHAHADLDAVSTFLLRLRTGQVNAVPMTAALVIGLFIVAGLRGLLFGHLPLVGQLVPLPPATVLLGRYFVGTPPAVGGHTGTSAPGYAVLGLLGLVLGNSSALALRVLLLCGVAVGSFGASRLVRPFGPWARVAAAAAFAAAPFTWNAVARGDVSASVALACSPFLLVRLARASGLEPYSEARRTRGRLATEIAGMALLLGLVVSFAPLVLVALPAAMLCVAVFLLATNSAGGLDASLRAVVRSAVVSLGGAAGAIVLTMPWSLSWLLRGGDWSLLTGARGEAGSGLAPLAYLTGHLGPFGGWWGAFGLLVAGVVAVVIGRGHELRWGTAFLAVALGAAALSWAAGRGLLGSGFGQTGTLTSFVPAAVAGAVGATVAALEKELGRHRLGWRQMLAALAVVSFAVAVVSGLGAFLPGSAQLPQAGYHQYMGWTGSTSGAPRGASTLWLGQPETLPGASLQVAPGLAAFVSSSGLPSTDQLFPVPPGPGMSVVSADLAQAEAGRTASLGASLASEGIRYIVVPSALAPMVPGLSPALIAKPPSSLVTTLEAQTDLQQRVTEAGVLVFQNTAWTPSDGSGGALFSAGAARSERAGSSQLSPQWRIAGLVVALFCLAAGIGDLLGWRRGRHASRRVPRSVEGATT